MRVKFLLVFCLAVVSFHLFGQYMPDNEADQALQLFNKGEYKRAYEILEKKLEIYSKDPYLNYYAGIALWKIEGKPDDVIVLLKNVLGKIREPDLYYALSDNFMQKQDFEQARYYMERCMKIANRKYIKENNLEAELAEIESYLFSADDNMITSVTNLTQGDSVQMEPDTLNIQGVEEQVQTDSLLEQDNIKTAIIKDDVEEELDEIYNYSKIDVSDLSVDGYSGYLAHALRYQKNADMLKVEKDNLLARRISDKDKKGSYYKQIRAASEAGNELQDSANRYFEQVVLLEKEFQNEYVDKERQHKSHNTSAENETKVNSDDEIKFEILDTSPYSEANLIPYRQSNESTLVYSVQMGVFSKVVAYDFFGGISPVFAEEIRNGTMIKYYAGSFKTYALAYEALKGVREKGFKDAYIIAWFKGVKTSINRAREIENELYKY